MDNSPLSTRYLSASDNPEDAPVTQRYPAAGGPNAKVILSIIDLNGERLPVRWDSDTDEYLIAASWDAHDLTIVVQNRAQDSLKLLSVDPGTGATSLLRQDRDTAWVLPIPGVPGHLDDGTLVWAGSDGQAYRLYIGTEAVTPPDMHVAEVCDVDNDTVLFRASGDPFGAHLWTWSASEGLRRVTTDVGRHTGRLHSGLLLTISFTLGSDNAVCLRAKGRAPVNVSSRHRIPELVLNVTFLPVGDDGVRVALLLPRDHVAGSASLPVLMDPYGGPSGQRATKVQGSLWTAQWFADQGFAVVVADGRGVPGMGPVWDRKIHLNKVNTTVEDQVDGLNRAAEACADLDLSRVAIRGARKTWARFRRRVQATAVNVSRGGGSGTMRRTRRSYGARRLRLRGKQISYR